MRALPSDECAMPHDLSLDHLIHLYLDAMEAEGKSPKTITAYRESLRMYLRIASTEGLPLDAGEITLPDVYRYIAAIRRRGICDATQHRRHREMKHFFSWLRRMELVNENPFQKVPLIRLEQQIVQPFSADDIRKLLAVLPPDTFLGARNRAITLFLLDTGVRASELVGLNLADIDLEVGRARVLHGKGKKQRVVAFGAGVAEALRGYLAFRGGADGPLFQTRQGGRMLPQGLIVLYQRVGRKAGVERVHPHRFRHSFATMAIRQAAREIDVQHLLGHSTSAMVRRYTRTYDAEQAALAHASFSPVAHLDLASGEGTALPVPAAAPLLRATEPAAVPPAERRRAYAAGSSLVGRYLGEEFGLTVVEEDGSLHYRLDDGRTFSSLSAAGSAVIGGGACNGWKFWRLRSA